MVQIEFADGLIIEDVVDADHRIVGRRCTIVADEDHGWGEEPGVVEGVDVNVDGSWHVVTVRVDTGGPNNPDDPDGLREVSPEQVRLLIEGDAS